MANLLVVLSLISNIGKTLSVEGLFIPIPNKGSSFTAEVTVLTPSARGTNIFPSVNFSSFHIDSFRLSCKSVGVRVFNHRSLSGVYGGVDIGILNISDSDGGYQVKSKVYISFSFGVRLIHRSGFTFDFRLGIMEGRFKATYISDPQDVYMVFPILPLPSLILIGWTF